MAKQLIPLNELERVSGGVLTYQNQELDMSMTVEELDNMYSSIGIRSKIEAEFGTYIWQILKVKTLQAVCNMYGESVLQDIIDNYSASQDAVVLR